MVVNPISQTRKTEALRVSVGGPEPRSYEGWHPGSASGLLVLTATELYLSFMSSLHRVSLSTCSVPGAVLGIGGGNK